MTFLLFVGLLAVGITTSASIWRPKLDEYVASSVKRVVDELNGHFKGTIGYGKAQYLFPNGLSLKDPYLLDDQGENVLSAKLLQLEISITSLLSNTITLPNILLDEARCDFIKDKNGLNLLEAFEKNSESGGRWNFVVERFEIKNANLNFTWKNVFSIHTPSINQIAQIKIFPNTKFFRAMESNSSLAILSVGGVSKTLENLRFKDLHLGKDQLGAGNVSTTWNDHKIEGNIALSRKLDTLQGGALISPAAANSSYQLNFMGPMKNINFFLKANLGLPAYIGEQATFTARFSGKNLFSPQEKITLGGSSTYQITKSRLVNFEQGKFDFDLSGNYQEIKLNALALASNKNTLKASGSLLPTLDLSATIEAEKFNYMPELPAQIFEIKGLASTVSVTSRITDPLLQFAGTLGSIANQTYKFEQLSVAGEISRAGASIDSLSGVFQNSSLLATGSVGFHPETTFDLDLKVAELSIPSLRIADLKSIQTANISADLRLHGSLNDWLITGHYRIPNLITSIEPLGFLSGNFQWNGNVLQLEEAQLDGPYMSISSDLIRYRHNERELEGIFDALHIDLSRLNAHFQIPVEGTAQGSIKILFSPDVIHVDSHLNLVELKALGIPLGSGPLKLSHDDFWQGAIRISDEQGATIQAEMALNDNLDSIKLKGNLVDFNIYPWTLQAASPFVPLKGTISGSLNAKGTLSNPEMSMLLETSNLRSEQLIFSASTRAGLDIEDFWQQLGAFEVKLGLNRQHLTADICNFPLPRSAPNSCPTDSAIRLHIDGSIASERHFDFGYRGKLNTTKIPHLLNSARQIATTLDVAGSIQGKMRQRPGEPLKYAGTASLDKFFATAPGIRKLALSEPALVLFSNDGISIEKQTQFVFDDGYLKASGKMLTSDLDLDLQGHIPLILARQFLPGILGARGALDGNLAIRGTRENPNFSGTLKVLRGGFLSFSNFLEPVTFRSGSLIFDQDNGTSSFSFDNLLASVGDGTLSIDGGGTLDALGHLSTLSAELSAQEIVLRQNENWIEGSLELQATYEKGVPKVSGKSNVFDGYFHTYYTFNDLVLSAAENSPTLSPFAGALGETLQLDLATTVEGIDINADLDVFAVRSEIAAKMNISGTLKKTNLRGTVDILSGEMNFPGAILDIQPTVVTFLGEQNLNPQVDIVALGILQQGMTLGQDNINITASLKGPLQQMKMKLGAASPDRLFDTFQTFMILMQPESFDSRNAQESLVSISSSVLTSPLTGEIGKYISQQTNSSFRIGTYLQTAGLAAQLQWRLGPRIVFEGTAQTSANAFNVSNLKIQLLLFDHLPLGQSLFFEGIFLANRQLYSYNEQYSAIRLKYRLWQK